MSGRFEFAPGMFAMFGEDPLPHFEEPAYSPVSMPELSEEYPLVLTTGARSILFFHSENRQIPRLRELNPNPLIEINPETAKAKGISEGQWVRVWNMFGEAYYKAKLSPIVDEGTVMAQHGWWFPEQDGNEPNLYGTFRSNINNLIPYGKVGSFGFGAPYKSIFCFIMSFLINYFLMSVPDSQMANAIGNGISGLGSGVMTAIFGLGLFFVGARKSGALKADDEKD